MSIKKRIKRFQKKRFKLITDWDKFKVDHLYYEVDDGDAMLFVIVEIGSYKIECLPLEDESGDPYRVDDTDEFKRDNVSLVPYGDKDFDQESCFGYYHVGKKSDHPEYFLWIKKTRRS